MTIDIEKIRSETPGVDNSIHLLASGSALMPQPVIDAIINHTLLEARMGGYEAQAEESEKLEATYQSIATLIGAKKHEIALMENATAAWCHAFYALPSKAGDRVLTCEAEYAANYVAYLQRVKRDGIVIDVIPSDESGAIDTVALEAMIDERGALIAITWIPTNGGLVNPAAEVGKIAKRHGITYLLDACQAVGQMPVNVQQLGCDFLSATGRKFLRGPRGTGFLYVTEALIEGLEPIVIDHFAAPWVAKDQYQLRGDVRRFENWENSYALRSGLSASAEYAMAIGLDDIQKRSWHLANYLRGQLSDMPGVLIRDLGVEQCAIVSFTIDGKTPSNAVPQLRHKNIIIGASDPSSTRLDAESRNLPTVMRAAPHYYNTENEMDQLIAALKSLI
ncbi:aminotransferase class V-fold PLP-dependent enzyme [Marinomonas flavescens]|uniref:aminotransferase class V-fold PLP-dependent enzyme n=1 Tax=Marinomonas flavescens TaxID=2529379 RepID=UPI001055295E|nr:aminotransferase class V-fold PLP-dependent enzyme [Marinomonas flavescens]